MRAVYTGGRAVVVEPDPAVGAPGAGEVTVEVAYAGVCATDLHVARGDADDRLAGPVVLGHEMSGTVAAVGADVVGWRVGDPVTVMPLVWCSTCPACTAGLTHVCHHLRLPGLDLDGALQRHWTVPADRLVALPAGLDLRAAALVEPTALAVHEVARTGVTAGEHVVVVGAGPAGVLVAVVAADRGADVVLVEADAGRRAVAAAAGLEVLDPAAIDVLADVEQWTAGVGAAVAFEVSGTAAGVDTAVDVLATRGRLCLVAADATRRELDVHRFSWRELVLVGARSATPQDWERAVDLVARGVVPVEHLVTAVVPLVEVTAAIEAVGAADGVMKVLVDLAPR